MRDHNLDAVAARAATGDGPAFESLCRALQDDVWRYCYALLGDHHLAEEAAQDAFLRAAGAIGGYRGEGPARVWLLVLARRAAARVLHQHIRHRQDATLLPPPPQAAPAQASAVEIHLLIESLPEPQRQAFALTQIVGLPYEDAAAVCACRVGTIRSRVYRARERLVAMISDQEDRHAHG